MIYLYTGENDFAIAEKVRAVSAAFKKKYLDVSLERIDGNEVTPANLAAKLTSIDMFTPRKLLVLANMGKKRNIWEALAQSIPLVPDSTEVVIIEPKPDGRLGSTKSIKKSAKITEFKPLRPHELKYWTGTIAQNISVEIDGNAAALLIEFCEYNQWNILHEIHKLSHIATVITVDIIKQYVQPNLEADIFTVLELAVSQNFYALNQAIDALKHKEDISKFLGLLASQVFTLAAIKNSNKNNNIARDMSLAPFLVVKQQSLACKITDHQLSGLIKRLAELDGRVKLGEDGWLLIMLTFNKLFR